MTIVLLVALAGALAAFDVYAQSTRHGSPFDVALLTTYAWIIAISLLGGIASFWRKVRDGHARWFNLAELVGELFISAFAGVVTFLLGTWSGADLWLIAAFAGIAGHMGSRACFLLEHVFKRWTERLFGPGSAGNGAHAPQRGTPGDEA